MQNVNFGKHCPCCHKRIWWLKTYKHIDFCPHCHVSLTLKEQQKVHKKPMNRWLSLLISVILAAGLYDLTVYQTDIRNNVVLFFILPIFWVSVIVMLGKAIFFLEYQQGVDSLAKVTADRCDYLSLQPHIKQCPECQSARLVDMYWFKRILSRNQDSPPTMASIDNSSLFVGCLHCQAQYKMQANSKQAKLELKVVIFILIFLLLIFIFNRQFHQLIGWFMSLETVHLSPLFYSICFSLHMFYFLTMDSDKHVDSAIELIRLDR